MKHTWFLLLFATCLSKAQIQEKKLDELIQNTLKTFDVPGISVGIIKDGKAIYSKGFGVRSLSTQEPMSDNTLVGIGSNTKAFTCTALAILADEGKLNWDDNVSKYIPEFQMYDAYVSKNITVRDLVSHRTGLGQGQGDLMFFPEGGDFTVNDIIGNVKYLKPENPFRGSFGSNSYNSIMFIVAGEIIHRISGLSWETFIEQRIMKPVGMTSSFASYKKAATAADKIDAHIVINGKAAAIPHDWNEAANAAGGIISNIKDMTAWAEFLLNNFTTKDGKKLVSDQQIQQLWSLQSISENPFLSSYDTHFYGSGLGWFLTDINGHKQVYHTGGLIGTVTLFILIPDLKLGIVVLTNQSSIESMVNIAYTIEDSYLGIPERNWSKSLKERTLKINADYEKQMKEAFGKASGFKNKKDLQPEAKQFVGKYNDIWFGDVEIFQQGKTYKISCKNSPKLQGELIPYSNNSFIVKWNAGYYNADAYIIFNFDENGTAESAKLKAVSEITDFSYDFDDLDLKRVK